MRITDFPMLSEIKAEYIQLRKNGISRHDASQSLIQNYADEITIGTEDDDPLFWISLADAQYQRKELTEEIAHKALLALIQIEHLDWNIPSGDIMRRRMHYAEAPMPERKAVSQRKYRCSWKMGDTFAYQLSGNDANTCGLSGKYVLLRKVDELEFGDGRLLPVVTFTIWDDKSLPASSAEFQRLPFLRLVSGRLGFPKTLHEYRAEILITSRKKLDALSLIYLGNFADIPMPKDEIIIRDAGRVMMVSPEQLDWECCNFWKWNSRNSQ